MHCQIETPPTTTVVDKTDWDDSVPTVIQQAWEKWRDDLPNLSSHLIQRRYFLDDVDIISTQLHGFSNASGLVYAGVVYIRGVDSNKVLVALVVPKTKVAPIKPLTMPPLELCDSVIMGRL